MCIRDRNIIVDPEKEREIVAGWYCTEDGRTTSIAHWLEEGDFRKNGGVMNHETLETMSKRTKPFTCDYTGFGWVLIKNGVFENEQRNILGLLQRCKSLSLERYRICVERTFHSV